MRRMLVSLFLNLLVTAGVFSSLGVADVALADHECARSCSLYCQQVVDDFEQVVASHRNYCSGPVDCVLNCVRRYSDGSCREYGPDYCARDAKCISKCLRRYADGSCREYAADFCGEGNINCARQCLRRYSDGSCREYGEDVCGYNASCVPNCIDRWSDGTCKEYGPDRCVN